MLLYILDLVALWAAYHLVRDAWDERYAPKTCWVYADRTIFVGMCTGSPGYTDPLCIGEQLTRRQAHRAGRVWCHKHPHGQAIIYVAPDGKCPTNYRRLKPGDR